MFTDKLSKMVAHYANLREMIFELDTSFDINTSWDSGWEESNQSDGQDLLAEKILSVTLNDISSRNEVRASRYLTLKKYKITVEEWRTTRHKTNLKSFVLRERLVDKNCWEHYVYQSDECALYGSYLCSSNWDRVTPKWFCHHSTASSCIHAVRIPKTYLTCNL